MVLAGATIRASTRVSDRLKQVNGQGSPVNITGRNADIVSSIQKPVCWLVYRSGGGAISGGGI